MKVLPIIAVAVLVSGCDERQENATVELPCDYRLVDVGWRDREIWYLVTPLKIGEKPKTYVYKKGVFGPSGEIILNEKVCRS